MASRDSQIEITSEREQDVLVGADFLAKTAQQISKYTYIWQRCLISLGLLFVVLFVLYWDTVVSIVSIWMRSDTYAHGFLVLPISAYLIWQRRGLLKKLLPSPNLLGLIILALLLLLWIAAKAAEVLVIQQLMLVAMIPTLVFLCLGRNLVKAMLFPLAYLFFAVPFGEFLVPALQDQTAWFAVKALELSGIPVYWEGRYLAIPGGDFEVAEGCSGIRYLIASIALCCIYAYLFYQSYWRRVGFIVLGIVVPILANGARAYGIVMLAYISDMRIATGVDHIIYGWIFFGLVMALLFWIGTFWRESVEQKQVQERLITVKSRAQLQFPILRQLILGWSVAMLILIGGAYANSSLSVKTSGAGFNVVLELPLASGDWKGPQPSLDEWQPKIIGADSFIYRQYGNKDAPLYFYAAYYGKQEHGKELVGSLNRLYDKKTWRRVYDEQLAVELMPGETIKVVETEIRSTKTRRLIWYWYDINGNQTSSQTTAKVLEAWEKLHGRHVEAMLVAIATNYELDRQEGRDRLKSFVAEVGVDIKVRKTPVFGKNLSKLEPGKYQL